jgi:fumarate reductase flavoprotein subunit
MRGNRVNNIKTDLAIVGGGTSGLAAAVAAAEKGAMVTIIEKASTTGGTGNMAMGPFAVESRLQKEKNVSLTKDEAFRIHMDYTHWKVDARMVKAYIDKSGDTISWLEDMGTRFAEVESQFIGAHCTHHNVLAVGGGTGLSVGSNMMKALTIRAKELGVRILLRTRALKVVTQEGCVVGVLAEDTAGEKLRVDAKAVIIGTGGFGDNPKMINKYTKHEYGKDMFPMKVAGMSGEGIRMAWDAGAGHGKTSMQIISSFPPPFNGRGGVRDELAAFRQPNLMVNLNGERFLNEEVLANTTFTGNAIFEQKNSCGFVIFDEDTKRHYEKNGMHFCDVSTVDDLDANIQTVRDEGCDCVYRADSLEELAAQTGIDLDGLRSTITEYNRACAMGRDDTLGKSAEYLRPVEKPKFYAGRHVPSAYGSLGGIPINHRTEVLDQNRKVIPGFYAIGTDANSIHGDSYVYIMPGGTMGFALNSGRIAGENASEYINSSR